MHLIGLLIMLDIGVNTKFVVLYILTRQLLIAELFVMPTVTFIDVFELIVGSTMPDGLIVIDVRFSSGTVVVVDVVEVVAACTIIVLFPVTLNLLESDRL